MKVCARRHVVKFDLEVITDMSQIANVTYTEYLRKLMAMRAAVVDTTQAIVNKASTNPPPNGKKQKLFDAVYLQHNNDQQLVVWSYGPSGRPASGHTIPRLRHTRSVPSWNVCSLRFRKPQRGGCPLISRSILS